LKWLVKCRRNLINKTSMQVRNKMLLVKYAMSACSVVMSKYLNVVISIIRNAFVNHLKSALAATPSLFDALMMNARIKCLRETSAISSINSFTKNIKVILLRHMLMNMVILFLGVRLLTVDTCSSMRKAIKSDSSVYSVKSSIAWIVELIGMKEWAVKSIRLQILSVRMTKNSSILWKGKNSNNALNVNFGCRRMKDAIIWPANVNFNFAINVEESTWNVNVFKKPAQICKLEEKRHNKECVVKSKEKMSY